MNKNISCSIKKNDKICSDVLIGNFVVLLDTLNGEFYWLNETASQLWNWLDIPTSSSQLIQKFKHHYKNSDLILQDDIDKWINDAIGKNLLCVAEDTDNFNPDNLSISNNYVNLYTKDIKLVPPITFSLECKNINGNANSFQTDNFETGS